MSTLTNAALPELPEPTVGLGSHRWAYSADDMRAYARAALSTLPSPAETPATMTRPSERGDYRFAFPFLSAETLAMKEPTEREVKVWQNILETGPFAFWVYVPAEQRGEFVHDLDDAIDDLTNCDCKVTPLYEAATTPASELDYQGPQTGVLQGDTDGK